MHVAGAIDGGRGETRPGGTFAAIAVICRRDGDIPMQQHARGRGSRAKTSRRAEATNAGLMTRARRSSTTCAIHSGAGCVRGVAVADPSMQRQAWADGATEGQTAVCVIGCLLFLPCGLSGWGGLRHCRRQRTGHGRRQFLRLLRLFRLPVTAHLTLCHRISPISLAADATLVSRSLDAFDDAVAIYFRWYACRPSRRAILERRPMPSGSWPI